MIEAVIEALAVGVSVHDDQGQIIMFNSEAENLLGLSRNQVIGLEPISPEWSIVRKDMSPFHGEDLPAAITIKTGKAVENVVMGVKRPDGSLAWLSVTSKPHHVVDDSITRQITVVTFRAIDKHHRTPSS